MKKKTHAAPESWISAVIYTGGLASEHAENTQGKEILWHARFFVHPCVIAGDKKRGGLSQVVCA